MSNRRHSATQRDNRGECRIYETLRQRNGKLTGDGIALRRSPTLLYGLIISVPRIILNYWSGLFLRRQLCNQPQFCVRRTRERHGQMSKPTLNCRCIPKTRMQHARCIAMRRCIHSRNFGIREKVLWRFVPPSELRLEHSEE